jgi:ring-1,2-phenylacetyl-CoA epoxidase subunit PaaD
MVTDALAVAVATAGTVTDPELPMLTLVDLGVLRDVRVSGDGAAVAVSLTPTYTGCPAMDAMRDDLERALRGAGFDHVRIEVVLHPAWTTDWISEDGRRKLAEAGIAPPAPAGAAPRHRAIGPIPLTLTPPARRVPCPCCGCDDTELISEFSATACKALRRCRACREPFEHVKEI